MVAPRFLALIILLILVVPFETHEVKNDAAHRLDVEFLPQNPIKSAQSSLSKAKDMAGDAANLPLKALIKSLMKASELVVDQAFGQMDAWIEPISQLLLCLAKQMRDFIAMPAICKLDDNSPGVPMDTLERIRISGTINPLTGVVIPFEGVAPLCHKLQMLKKATAMGLNAIRTGNVDQTQCLNPALLKQLGSLLEEQEETAQHERSARESWGIGSVTSVAKKGVSGAKKAGSKVKQGTQKGLKKGASVAKQGTKTGLAMGKKTVSLGKSLLSSGVSAEDRKKYTDFIDKATKTAFSALQKFFDSMAKGVKKCDTRQLVQASYTFAFAPFVDLESEDSLSICAATVGAADFAKTIAAVVPELPPVKHFPKAVEMWNTVFKGAIQPLMSLAEKLFFSAFPEKKAGVEGQCNFKGRKYTDLAAVKIPLVMKFDVEVSSHPLPVISVSTKDVNSMCQVAAVFEKVVTKEIPALAKAAAAEVGEAGPLVMAVMDTVIKVVSLPLELLAGVFEHIESGIKTCQAELGKLNHPLDLFAAVPTIYIPPGYFVASWPGVRIKNLFKAGIKDMKAACALAGAMAHALPGAVEALDKALSASPLALLSVDETVSTHDAQLAGALHAELMAASRARPGDVVALEVWEQQRVRTRNPILKGLIRGMQEIAKHMINGKRLKKLAQVPLCVLKQVLGAAKQVLTGPCKPVKDKPKIAPADMEIDFDASIEIAGFTGLEVPSLGRMCSMLMVLRRATILAREIIEEPSGLVKCLGPLGTKNANKTDVDQSAQQQTEKKPEQKQQQAKHRMRQVLAAPFRSRPPAQQRLQPGVPLPFRPLVQQPSAVPLSPQVEAAQGGNYDYWSLMEEDAAVEGNDLALKGINLVMSGLDAVGMLIWEASRAVRACKKKINPKISLSIEVDNFGSLAMNDAHATCSITTALGKLISKSDVVKKAVSRLPIPMNPPMEFALAILPIGQALFRLPILLFKNLPERNTEKGTCKIDGKVIKGLGNVKLPTKLNFNVKVGSFQLPKVTMAGKTALDLCLLAQIFEHLTVNGGGRALLGDTADEIDKAMKGLKDKLPAVLKSLSAKDIAKMVPDLPGVVLVPLTKVMARVAKSLSSGEQTCRRFALSSFMSLSSRATSTFKDMQLKMSRAGRRQRRHSSRRRYRYRRYSRRRGRRRRRRRARRRRKKGKKKKKKAGGSSYGKVATFSRKGFQLKLTPAPIIIPATLVNIPPPIALSFTIPSISISTIFEFSVPDFHSQCSLGFGTVAFCRSASKAGLASKGIQAVNVFGSSALANVPKPSISMRRM